MCVFREGRNTENNLLNAYREQEGEEGFPGFNFSKGMTLCLKLAQMRKATKGYPATDLLMGESIPPTQGS